MECEEPSGWWANISVAGVKVPTAPKVSGAQFAISDKKIQHKFIQWKRNASRRLEKRRKRMEREKRP